MVPIIAPVPTPWDFTLGVSLVMPALGALALCGAALVHAVAQRALRRATPWSAARPSYASAASR